MLGTGLGEVPAVSPANPMLKEFDHAQAHRESHGTRHHCYRWSDAYRDTCECRLVYRACGGAGLHLHFRGRPDDLYGRQLHVERHELHLHGCSNPGRVGSHQE